MRGSTSSEMTGGMEFGRIVIPAIAYYCVDRGSAEHAAPVLLGLHGYGQTGMDFCGVMRKIVPEEWVAAAGQGLNQLWSGPKGGVSFSWLTSYEKEDSIVRNNAFIDGLLNRLTEERVIDPARVFLLGFSQGSSVAYRFAQRNPGRVAGLISVCSDLPPDVEKDLEPLKNTPVLILYGLQDKLFPIEKSEHALKALTAGGVDAESIAFDRGHIVPSSLAPEIRAWMRRVMTEGPRRRTQNRAEVSS